MISAPKDGYIKALCIKGVEFIDKVWGDCSLIEGKWYQVLDEHHMSNSEYFMVKFGNYPMSNLVPYERKHFKTESQLREEKLNSIL
jgi:hypothetical protein